MHNVQFTYLDKMIHEMNGPLHAICLLSEVMLLDKSDTGAMDNKQNLQHIYDSAEKLKKIVSLLSSITNLKSDKINVHLEELDLVHLVKQEVNHQQIRNKTNSDLTIDLINKVPSSKVKVDKFWFKQLVANIIINAIHHCEKGLIQLYTNTFKKDNTDYFRLSVSDEGCGVPEGELETIFKPLERGSHSLEKKIPGSGIGLAIAKEIVEAHGGSICARNNPKVGATFEVLIPLTN